MRPKSSRETASELQLELKYCERCGGLWLRPAGRMQVYCATCAGEMAKLPAVSRRVESSISGASCWDDEDYGDWHGEESPDEAGGVA